MSMTIEPAKPAEGAGSTQWELLPLERNAWRLCDGSRGPHDPSRLVGYIERTDYGTLDVLWLRSPCPVRSRYRSMEELLGDLDAAVANPTAARSAPPTVIPHFPPTGLIPRVDNGGAAGFAG